MTTTTPVIPEPEKTVAVVRATVVPAAAVVATAVIVITLSVVPAALAPTARQIVTAMPNVSPAWSAAGKQGKTSAVILSTNLMPVYQ
jgi:hypothetical protein